MTKRMQHCFWCGEELGEYQHYPGDIEHCGKAECAHEARNAEREVMEVRQERAQEDGYERYA